MIIKKIFFVSSLVFSCLFLPTLAIHGAGSSDDDDSYYEEANDENYMNGKEEAYKGNFREAIVYLKKSIEKNSSNADAFNMLGYSNRKLGNNEDAFKYYNKALEIDPRHRGTHEYIGRLYLNISQPEKAKKHLDKLDKICFFACDEYLTLKKAIENYEKNKEVKNY